MYASSRYGLLPRTLLLVNIAAIQTGVDGWGTSVAVPERVGPFLECRSPAIGGFLFWGRQSLSPVHAVPPIASTAWPDLRRKLCLYKRSSSTPSLRHRPSREAWRTKKALVAVGERGGRSYTYSDLDPCLGCAGGAGSMNRSQSGDLEQRRDNERGGHPQARSGCHALWIMLVSKGADKFRSFPLLRCRCSPLSFYLAGQGPARAPSIAISQPYLHEEFALLG